MESLLVDYFDDLEKIEADWRTIYNSSSLSYFCSLEWHYIVRKLFNKTFLTKRIHTLKYFSVSNSAENKIILVGFFYLTKQKGKNRILFSHLLGPSDYYDFIYSDNFDKNLISIIISKIIDDTNAKSINIAHIKNDASLQYYIAQKDQFNMQKIKCVSVYLPKNYELYYNNLSKNARQNLRTALNRLKKSNLTISFSIKNKDEINTIDFNQLKEIYKLRNKNKIQKLHWKSKIYLKLDSLFSGSVDFFDLEEIKNTNFTLGVLEIDNKIAAYFFGFNKENKIEINRVAICEAFKFYSPGILLFNEYVKIGIEEGLQNIDLTVGDEKYKYDLGGITHEITNAINFI